MKRLILLLLCLMILAGCASQSEPVTTAPTETQTVPTEPTQPTVPTVPTEPETTVTEAPTTSPTEPEPTEPAPTEPPTTEPTQPKPTVTDPPTEPTEPDEPKDPLTAYMDKLSLEELVGQLFLARCPSSGAVSAVKNYHLGGYILFAQDFEGETPASIRSTIQKYQNAADIPMLIAVDEEGGKVNRVSKYTAFRATPFESPRDLYDRGGLDAIRETEAEKSALLHSLGINVNLAPVCDITTDPEAFMYPRSLGQDALTTAAYVKAVLEVNKSGQIANALKHFPGYGNNTDTHVAIAVDDRSLAQLEACDLIPFQAGIDAGCGAIMVSHTFINAIDPDLPATLSPAVHDYLRSEMGFDGVLITDDLVMQAITDLYGAEEAAIMAVQAGNDLLISTNFKTQYNAVLNAVKNGTISRQTVWNAARRVLQWKIDMGILSV